MTKETQEQEALDKQRRQLWADVYVAYVASSNSTSSDLASKWADDAVKKFDDRFKPSAAEK